MCDQYRAPFEREFAGKEPVQVLELSLLDKPVFRLIRGWVQRNLRKRLDPQRHVSLNSSDCNICYPLTPTHTQPVATPSLPHTQSLFLVCSEGVEQLRVDLEIGNSIVGYAYLVDKEGLIRWRAHASPTEREIRAMIKNTRKLLGVSKNSHSKGHR